MIDAPEIDPKAVARRMRIQMQLRNMKIVSLARVMGISATRVEELVLGRSTIGPQMAALIAECLLTGKVRP